MVKKEKKEIPYVLDIKTYHDKDKISNYSQEYFIKAERDIKFEVSTRTSSCGSIQLMNLFVDKYHQLMDSGLSKEQRQEIFDKIKDSYEDHNHIFFIDCNEGGLEKFFGDLGFTKCWEYGNTNTENIVNMWCYNKLTIDEVMNKEDDDDDIWNDEDDY